MAKGYSRVQRGMVFWFNPIKAYGEPREFIGYKGKTYKSSIQSGERPWLVTSNNEGNASSPTCNIIPITSEEKTRIPVHVYFQFEGKKQTILCEQPRTVDIMALSDYAYTVSDDVMVEVERAIQIQHSIRPEISYTDFNLDNTVKYLEDIVSKIIEGKVKVAQAAQDCVPISKIEDTALQLGQMIEDLVGTVQKETPKTVEQPVTKLKSAVEEVKAEQPKVPEKPSETVLKQGQKKPSKPNYSGMSAVEKFNAKYNKASQPTPVPVQTEKKPSKRNTWTLEKRQEYLDDCEKMPPQEIMKKYHFTSIQSVFQTKYACKNALNKN